MAKKPRVSVIVPSYNHGNYLRDTLKSIVNQTYEDLEILILDDGSTDNSVQIAQEFAKADRRVRLLQQPNAGLLTTLNRLFDQTQGDFICQVDSDDMLLPDRIRWGVEDLERDDTLSASFTSFVRIDANNQMMGETSQLFLGSYQSQIVAQRLVVANFLCACTGFMRRSSLVAAGGFARKYTLVHDWDRWLRLSLTGGLYLRSEVGAIYRVHDKNQSLDTLESNRQQIAISTDLAHKVMRHYNMHQQMPGYVHGAMANRWLMAKDYPKVIEHLAQKSNVLPLQEAERIWLMKSFLLSGRYLDAKALLELLMPVKEHMTPQSRVALDQAQQALSVLGRHRPAAQPMRASAP